MEQASFKKSYQASLIIAAVFFVFLLIYVAVVEIIRWQFSPFYGFATLEDIQSTRLIFFGLAALQVIAIRVLRGIMLRKTFSDNEATLASKLFRSFLISFALAEIPAILGLVLFFLAGLVRDFYILLIVSVVLMFMFFPRYHNWKSWIEEEKKRADCCR